MSEAATGPTASSESRTATQTAPQTPESSEVAARLDETLAALDAALMAPPADLKTATHEAILRVVRLRDLLIRRLRAATASEEQVADRATLDQVNVAISLMLGVEYPIDKMDSQPLAQAKGILLGHLQRLT